MNPRKLLALLGPRSPSLTRLMHREFGLRGSTTPMTPQDVAGALGWVKHRTARDLYLLLWFPGYADRPGNSDRVIRHIGGLLRKEWEVRSAPGYRAPAAAFPAFPPFPPKWQADPLPGCVAVAKAVLFELQHREDCPACCGYGMVPRQVRGDIKLARCESCAGQGYLPYSRSQRARLVKTRRQAYYRHVDPVYTWLLGALRELEQHAAHAHYVALRDPEDKRS